MPQQGWRSRQVLLPIAIGAAVLGISALFTELGIRNQEPSDHAALPPIMPVADAPHAEPQFRIPRAFTAFDDARASTPLSQREVRWVFSDVPNLPPLISPCDGYLPSDAARVGAHQLALVSPTVWKMSRVVVYRDIEAAKQAMNERRVALQQCARHDDGGGITTRWISQPSAVGEEGMVVGSQRYRGSNAVPGHQRGIVVRQGRTVVTYLDFGQSRNPPTVAEIRAFESYAQRWVTRLSSAPWNGSA